MSCHALLQGIFLTQGLNPRLLHWQMGSLSLVPSAKCVCVCVCASVSVCVVCLCVSVCVLVAPNIPAPNSRLSPPTQAPLCNPGLRLCRRPLCQGQDAKLCQQRSSEQEGEDGPPSQGSAQPPGDGGRLPGRLACGLQWWAASEDTGPFRDLRTGQQATCAHAL